MLTISKEMSKYNLSEYQVVMQSEKQSFFLHLLALSLNDGNHFLPLIDFSMKAFLGSNSFTANTLSSSSSGQVPLVNTDR